MPDPANDPTSPTYAPAFTGETDDGDVGSGQDFGTSLYLLYAAGRVHLPDTADAYARAASAIHDIEPLLARVVDYTGGYLDKLLQVRDDLQVGFYKTSTHLSEAAEALVVIADDYVRTDEEAADSFTQWRTRLAPPAERSALDAPTPAPPDPPMLNDPHDELAPPTYPLPTPGGE